MILFDKAIAVLRDPEASSDAKDLAEQIVREWKERETVGHLPRFTQVLPPVFGRHEAKIHTARIGDAEMDLISGKSQQ